MDAITFLLSINNMFKNRYSKLLDHAISKANQIVVLPLGLRNKKEWDSIVNYYNRSVSFFIDLGVDDLIDTNRSEMIGLEDVIKLNSCCILVEWDGLSASYFVEYLRSKGCRNIFYIGFLSEETEVRNVECIKSHLWDIWKVYKMLEDDLSKKTYLSTLANWIDGDFSKIAMSEYDQYNHFCVRADGNDIVVDGGAFDGMSSLDFSRRLSKNGMVYAFEPIKSNFNKMLNNFKNLSQCRCVPICAGLGKKEGMLFFSDDGSASEISEVAKEGHADQIVKIVNLDHFMEGKINKIDLIKLDIEGFEMDCLEGARNLIIRDKPKLQICIYHRLSDFWEIPLFIERLVPEYKFFVGHHYIKYGNDTLERITNEKQREISLAYNTNNRIKHHIETVLYGIVR